MPVMKPPVISILLSSDDDDDGIFEEEELESEFSSQDDSDYSESDDQVHDEEEENDVESDDEECFDNQGSNDSKGLSLIECKAYLRKHGLRLSGTKEECRQRIKEHERLKDAGGELAYPRSSFSINCTGDACKGDVVLFKQKVQKKYDKGANRRNIVWKRTVAGRIVKESYGASKQQHTFTVEVLWNKGSKKLPVLSTLLVKGRNLYRYGTYRQLWKSEAERSKVLEEKHRRGEAARHTRRSNRSEIASNNNNKRKFKKIEIVSNNIKGRKRQKGPTPTPKQKSTSGHKKKVVHIKKTVMPFRPDPNRLIYSNHHHHQQPPSSSSSLPFLYDRISSFPHMPPLGFPHYTIGQPPQPNHAMHQYQYQYEYQNQNQNHYQYQYQPRGYHHHTI